MKMLSPGLWKYRPKRTVEFTSCELSPSKLDSWVKSFRRVMEERFDNLDDYLGDLQNKNCSSDDSH